MPESMRVGINARLLRSPNLRGWNRYTVNLLAQLAELGVDLYLYSDRSIDSSHLERFPAGSYRLRLSPEMSYPRWEQIWLPRACAQDGVSLFHSPYNFGIPCWSRCPSVITLHDSIDRSYYARRQSRRENLTLGSLKSRLLHWSARTRAKHVITDSRHSKTEISECFQMPLEKITVIYAAADPKFAQPVSGSERTRVRQSNGLSRPYILYAGGWEGRKNVGFLLRSFAAARLEGVDLFLAGGETGQIEAMENLAAESGVRDRVRFWGWIPDADLHALYAEALCFVYPSEYEGFGLQLCESMSAGCPTLAARATSLPEVLGTGGETFSLHDGGELASLLQRLVAEPVYRQELAARARSRALDFSWRRTAEQTLEVYRYALGAVH